MNETAYERLLKQRRSARGFTAQRVPRSDIERILRAARQAPSGANLQPGAFHVLTGDALSDLSNALAAVLADGAPQVSEYSYFPDPFPAELKERQRAAGFALYAALGIEKRDIAGRRAQFEHNYRFFDAPVGIVVTIDRNMGKGCFMDLGMTLMALFLAAEDLGYATTGIGALANYAPVVHGHLGLDDGEMVVCGIALGRKDENAPANSVRTERADLEEYSRFLGFED